MGGGTGWILKSIRHHCPTAKIHFIDISTTMVDKARTRVAPDALINFIVGNENNIPAALYDGVITNFYLDMFNQETLKLVINKIMRVIQPGSHWLVVDFEGRTNKHSAMLWIMYRFFRFVTGIEATRLPLWQNQLKFCKEISLQNSKEYSNGFIRANIYTVN